MSASLPADLTEQPWALLRSTLQTIIDQGSMPLFAGSRQEPQARRQGMITVLPIRGAIEHRASILGDLLGGTSVEAIRSQLSEAVDDPDVAAIVLDVDSPGGAVMGMTELAGEIREAREAKPIIAVANGTAASAAYWLASQADRVYATPSGQVGSIGIYAVHQDVSGALEAEGVKVSIIAAGEHKLDGHPLQPLTDDARAQMQHRVDAYYDQFVGDVAKGRRVSTETVLEDYGAGRTFGADEAQEAGLVDEVGTLADAVRQVARNVRSSGLRAEQEQPEERLPFSTRVQHQASDLAALVAHAKVRADLRARESRPAFSSDIEASLRSIHDDALALAALLPADPVEEPEATPPADEPPEPVAPPPAPRPPRRFNDRAAWLAHLEASLQ
jgi:signal peptide peptidase SppA